MRFTRVYASAMILSLCSLFIPDLPAFAVERGAGACPVDYRTKNVFYRQLQKLKNPSAIEKAKILYLIEVVRGSSHTFIRNGEAHTGEKAAQHLKMKYGYAFGRVKTVEDFIDGIASQSSQTGKKYTIQTTAGEVRPARDFFYAELDALTECLPEDR